MGKSAFNLDPFQIDFMPAAAEETHAVTSFLQTTPRKILNKRIPMARCFPFLAVIYASLEPNGYFAAKELLETVRLAVPSPVLPELCGLPLLQITWKE